MKLIFMGTPDFAVLSLARLIEAGHQVAAVFTQPDKPAGRGNKVQQSPVKIFALEHGIPLRQPARIKTSEEVRAVFEQIGPDACVVAAYGKILPVSLLRIPRLGCINVHASLLPRYRGAAPINWVIARGERQTGVTIIQMDAGMDTGPMLASRATQIRPDETAPELAVRLSTLGAELLTETLPLVEAGRIEPQPQDDSQATYAPLLKREHGLVDWNLSAGEIGNRIRAFQPWPGTYTFFRGAKLIFWRAHEVSIDPSAGVLKLEGAADIDQAGTIVAADKTGFTILCPGASALRVEEVQLEGRRRMAASDFINGARLKVRDRIPDDRGQSSPGRR